MNGMYRELFARILVLIFCLTITLLQTSAYGQSVRPAQETGRQLFGLTLHEASPDECDEIQGYLEELKLQYTMLDKYAVRCEGKIFANKKVELFAFLHAEDRSKDAERHAFVRKFLEDDDPLLSVSYAGDGGYDTSFNGDGHYHHIYGDRLQLKNKNYVTSDPRDMVLSRDLSLTGYDRYMSPLACAFLPYGNIFGTAIARRAPTIRYLKPDRIGRKNGIIVASFPTQFLQNKDLRCHRYIAFRDGVPVAHEVWSQYRDQKESAAQSSRSDTLWEVVGKHHVPISMEIVGLSRGRPDDVISASFEWRFDDEVSDELFEISDVEHRRNLDW